MSRPGKVFYTRGEVEKSEGVYVGDKFFFDYHVILVANPKNLSFGLTTENSSYTEMFGATALEIRTSFKEKYGSDYSSFLDIEGGVEARQYVLFLYDMYEKKKLQNKAAFYSLMVGDKKCIESDYYIVKHEPSFGYFLENISHPGNNNSWFIRRRYNAVNFCEEILGYRPLPGVFPYMKSIEDLEKIIERMKELSAKPEQVSPIVGDIIIVRGQQGILKEYVAGYYLKFSLNSTNETINSSFFGTVSALHDEAHKLWGYVPIRGTTWPTSINIKDLITLVNHINNDKTKTVNYGDTNKDPIGQIIKTNRPLSTITTGTRPTGNAVRGKTRPSAITGGSLGYRTIYS